MYKIKDLYDLNHTLANNYLNNFTYPWEALKGIKEFIIELGKSLDSDYLEIKENVWVHKTATVFESAYLVSSNFSTDLLAPINAKNFEISSPSFIYII